MNALILMAVYIAGVAVFESVAVGIGFVTDVMWPTWSMIIFLGTTAAGDLGGLAAGALADPKRPGLNRALTGRAVSGGSAASDCASRLCRHRKATVNQLNKLPICVAERVTLW